MSSSLLLAAKTLLLADRALVLSLGLPIHTAHALLQDGLCSKANKSGKQVPVCTPALWLPGPEDCWLRPPCVTCIASSCLKGKKKKKNTCNPCTWEVEAKETKVPGQSLSLEATASTWRSCLIALASYELAPSCLDLHIGWDHCCVLPHTLYILLLILVSEFTVPLQDLSCRISYSRGRWKHSFSSCSNLNFLVPMSEPTKPIHIKRANLH